MQGKIGAVREFVTLLDPACKPTAAQLEAAIRSQSKYALGRAPSADELKRFVGLYEKWAKGGDTPRS